MESDKGPKPTSDSSFVRPFLYALNRMKANENLTPNQYLDRAKMTLVDQLGAAGSLPQSAFTPGVIGIMADHTHYFDGFALLLRSNQGLAVALRPNTLGRHRIVLDGVEDVLLKQGKKDKTSLFRLFEVILKACGMPPADCYDVALVASIPTGFGAAFQGAFAICLVRTLKALQNQAFSELEVRNLSLSALNEWYGYRFSPAFVVGSMAVQTEPFVLVDTGSLSHLPIDIPLEAQLGWGVVEWTKDWDRTQKGVQSRNERATQALIDLKNNGFERVETFRNLEHRELEQAAEAVPRRSKSALKHLVTENRNVQKLIVAIKKADWQFFGALMMISQASKTHFWSTTEPIHELITKEAETAALDGIFGVVQSGEGGCMLVFGQPFSVPAFLDSVREKASAHTTEEVETFII